MSEASLSTKGRLKKLEALVGQALAQSASDVVHSTAPRESTVLRPTSPS